MSIPNGMIPDETYPNAGTLTGSFPAMQLPMQKASRERSITNGGLVLPRIWAEEKAAMIPATPAGTKVRSVKMGV